MYSVRVAGLIFLVCCSITAFAQPGLDKFDINTGFTSSFPIHITQYGNKIACYANDGSKGWELYLTDGSSKPTMVNDMNPLAGSAIGLYSKNPIATIGSKLYFAADNGLNGIEVFSYNGSSTPLMTPEIVAGTDGCSPDNFTVLDGNLYFSACTAAEGCELWQYNPSMNQHTRLTNLNAGSDSSLTGNIIAFANKIYFSADSGSGNNELWMYDPVSSNVTLVDDINPGTAASNPQNMVVINGKLYFSAESAANGRELYVYDGTSLPLRITDVATGFQNGVPDVPQPIIAGFNNKIYFAGSDANLINQLYVYDPATSNTTMAASVNGTNTSVPQWLTPYGGKLYFTAYNDTTGLELWSYDGSNPPALVLDICKGATGSNPQQLLAVGDDLYFRANDCSGVGEELLKYNYKKLSLQRLFYNVDVKLYPNPAKETATLQVSFEAPTTMLVELTDMQGRIVYTSGMLKYSKGGHQINLPVAQLPAGTYLCNLAGADGKRYYNSLLTVQ